MSSLALSGTGQCDPLELMYLICDPYLVEIFFFPLSPLCCSAGAGSEDYDVEFPPGMSQDKDEGEESHRS